MIKNLIRNSELVLERNNQNTDLVGNRPHYPMLVLFNERFTDADREAIFKKAGRVWLQCMKYIVNYKYTVSADGTVSYADFNGNAVENSAVTESLDSAKTARDIFASMRRFCVYNIINTAGMKDVSEFAAQFNIAKQVTDTVVDPCKTMLIVLFDDSSASRAEARTIREFIASSSKDSPYDSTIIVSNRSRDNSMCSDEELFRITADVLLISNNDAVSETDDADYRTRVSNLYNKTPYILSYIMKDRPNQKIALKLCDNIIKGAVALAQGTAEHDTQYFVRKLDFQNARCEICEGYVRNASASVDAAIFAYLPVKQEAVTKSINFDKVPYKELRAYIYDDVFQGFVSNYCEKQLSSMVDVSGAAEDFKSFALQRLTTVELCSLSDSAIDSLIDQLQAGTANEGLSIVEYFRQCVQVHLRRGIVYPAMKKVLRELRQHARASVDLIGKISLEYIQNITTSSFDDIGTIYDSFTATYLQTNEGMDALNSIIAPGISKEMMINRILDCFKSVIKENKNHFNLPFIEEWAIRLNLTGDRIYRDISVALTKGAEENIRYYGNYPIDTRMKIIMLHTSDASGSNPTELFQHLKNTFAGDPHVQYFNTGFDDTLESLTFVACEGSNLIV